MPSPREALPSGSAAADLIIVLPNAGCAPLDLRNDGCSGPRRFKPKAAQSKAA
jgi:hypothetical protein